MAITEGQGHKAKRVVVLIAAACLVYAISGGLRANFGMIITALSSFTAIHYADVSFVMGVTQLLYGITQPLWGALALKRSNTLVLCIGTVLFLAGLIFTPFCRSVLTLFLTFGIALGAGSGALCFGILMGTISPIIGKEKASAASGILNASSGIGSAVLSPVLQLLNSQIGVAGSLWVLAIPTLLIFPIIFWIRMMQGNTVVDGADSAAASGAEQSSLRLLRTALREADFRRLMLGFSTCGFHMIIIQTHLVTQFVSYGITAGVVAGIYTFFGVATMAGSVLSGFLCSKFSLKNVLGTEYAVRAVIVALFMFAMPKNLTTAIIFALILGLTGDATVTPTSEIVSRRFGAKTIGFLFGMTFVCHQIGAFISSWLGGVLIEQTGSYTLIWSLDILLCAMAALTSYRIKRHEGE